jgi:hypothetical protein
MACRALVEAHFGAKGNPFASKSASPVDVNPMTISSVLLQYPTVKRWRE